MSTSPGDQAAAVWNIRIGRHAGQSRTSTRRALIAIAACAYALVCARLLLADVYLATVAASLPALGTMLLTTSAAAKNLQTATAWVVLFLAAAPWQSAAIASDTGAIDAASGVTTAKLILTALAFGLAYLHRSSVATYPVAVKILLLYAGVAALSGVLESDAFSSTLRVARLVAVVLAITWVATRLSQRSIALLVVHSTLVVSIVALVAHQGGLSTPTGGRLGGYLLPLHPNGLGLIAAAALLCAVALLARRELAPRMFFLCAPVLGATLILTQSRTSLLALIVGLVALSAPGLRSKGPIIVYMLVVAFLLAALAQTFTTTSLITSVLTHDETTTLTGTLGSRQSSWRAVWDVNAQTQSQAIGNGLAAKTVQVNLKSTRYASVDGTWPATYLSTGVVGVLLLAGAVLAALRAAVRRRDSLAVALCVFLLTTSAVVSVFNDITAGLILLLSLCIGPEAAPSSTTTPRPAVSHAAT